MEPRGGCGLILREISCFSVYGQLFVKKSEEKFGGLG